jgi:hypothetical protein
MAREDRDGSETVMEFMALSPKFRGKVLAERKNGENEGSYTAWLALRLGTFYLDWSGPPVSGAWSITKTLGEGGG